MIYLASPHNHDEAFIREQRYLVAAKVLADKAREGIVMYSPIVHWHEVAKMFSMPHGFEFWQVQDEAMIDICDEVWVLRIEGWDISRGIKSEIAYAESRGKPVRYI